MKDLSIIIINYKSTNEAIDCIKSIVDNTKGIDYEIIVIGNDFDDNAELLLSEYFSQIKYIQMPYNAGFARANNMGIANAKGEFILMLNPDTVVVGNALGETIAKMKKDTECFACGCQLLNEDGSLQFSGGYFERGTRWLLEVPYWRLFLNFILKKIINISNNSLPTGDVDWIIGAFLMVRRSTIVNAGVFDEDFFLYAEEIEWCSRIKKLGKLKIYDDVKVYHLTGASSKKEFAVKKMNNISDKRERQKILSVLVWLRKQYGVLWYLFSMLCFISGIPFYFLGKFYDCIVFKKSIKTMKEPINYIINVIIWLSFLPRIVINKRYFYKVI